MKHPNKKIEHHYNVRAHFRLWHVANVKKEFGDNWLDWMVSQRNKYIIPTWMYKYR